MLLGKLNTVKPNYEDQLHELLQHSSTGSNSETQTGRNAIQNLGVLLLSLVELHNAGFNVSIWQILYILLLTDISIFFGGGRGAGGSSFRVIQQYLVG